MNKTFIVIALVATVMVVSITVLLEILTLVAGWGILFGRVDIWKFLAIQGEETQLVLAIAAAATLASMGIVLWVVISEIFPLDNR